MADLSSRLEYLISGFAADQLSAAELDELLTLVPGPEAGDAVLLSVEQALNNHTGPLLLTTEAKQTLLEQIIKRRTEPEQVPSLSSRATHRIHFLKTAWFRYPAAVLIIIASVAYLWNTQRRKNPETAQTNPVPVQNDVLPGSDKAILTLSNGQKVVLDSTGQQTINDGNVAINNKNGVLTYEKSMVVVYNTMSTPKGGQYQVTLPDGTHVWLNAASSITYPTAFTGNTRAVSITGEAYFEVTKNKEKPFIVKLNDQEIKVLGTHFNVNAYAEEGVVRTTLLEGLVELRGNKYKQVLVPGEQAIVDNDDGELQVTNQVNVQEIVAWKNGNFYFDNQNLKNILQDFSRWYDVEVIYEGPLKNRTFFGVVKRDKPLSHVLKLLHDNNIQFRIEGRKLIVQSD